MSSMTAVQAQSGLARKEGGMGWEGGCGGSKERRMIT